MTPLVFFGFYASMTFLTGALYNLFMGFKRAQPGLAPPPTIIAAIVWPLTIVVLILVILFTSLDKIFDWFYDIGASLGGKK